MDREFVPMKQEILQLEMQLNTTAANEHVPWIKRQVQVVKERVRCV